MLGSIKHALRNLANPNGRDSRATFWYWVLLIFIFRFLAGMMISVPMSMKMMAAAVGTARDGAPASDEAVLKAMMDIVTNELPTMVWMGIGLGVLTMLLMAASLIRRLHDSDLPGWLVLIPGAIYGFALARAPQQIAVATELLKSMKPGVPPDMAAMMQQQGMMVYLGWIPALMILFIGLRKSTEGPNRYGDAPVTS